MSNEYLNQRYRQGSGECGVNANAVTGQGGYDGTGVDFYCLTTDWDAHADLPGVPLPAAHLSDATARKAGRAILGIVLAQGTAAQGLIGLAAGAMQHAHIIQIPPPSPSTAAEITQRLQAIPKTAGTVVLIDATTSDIDGDPLENLDADNYGIAHAIEELTRAGVIVIEPAGTRSAAPVDIGVGNEAPLNTNAWIVAAADRKRARLAPSNYGARVNFYALGDARYVWSLLEHNPPQPDYGQVDSIAIDPTRWAAAIIAGAALSAQGMALAARKRLFDRNELLYLVGLHGLQSIGASSKPIGVLPDLAVVRDALNCDVYVRDFNGDTGGAHTEGLLYMSPDIDVIHQGSAADFPALFGSQQSSIGEIELGERNRFGVQVRNAGSVAAANVVAKVYWADPSTFNDPSTWRDNLIGQSDPTPIPAGNAPVDLRIKPDWDPSMSLGHYCLIAVVSADGDPAPDLTAMPSMINFFGFVQTQNNVAWRNCEVVNNDPDQSAMNPTSSKGLGRKRPEEVEFDGPLPPEGFVPLDVIVPPTPHRGARTIVLETDLPPGAQALIQIPRHIVKANRRAVMTWEANNGNPADIKRPPEAVINAWRARHNPPADLEKKLLSWAAMHGGRNIALIPVDVYAKTTLPISLSPGESGCVRVLVHIPVDQRQKRFQVAVVDHLNGDPVGRFTFWLAPDGRPGLFERLAKIGRVPSPQQLDRYPWSLPGLGRVLNPRSPIAHLLSPITPENGGKVINATGLHRHDRPGGIKKPRENPAGNPGRIKLGEPAPLDIAHRTQMGAGRGTNHR